MAVTLTYVMPVTRQFGDVRNQVIDDVIYYSVFQTTNAVCTCGALLINLVYLRATWIRSVRTTFSFYVHTNLFIELCYITLLD